MQTTYDIFVSYPHKHRDWVRSFVEALEKHNLKVWFDEKAILPGESFVEKLEEGIRNSNAVVYIVTPEAVHSKWALIELGAALGGKRHLSRLSPKTCPLASSPPRFAGDAG
jgi:hypothetical protein